MSLASVLDFLLAQLGASSSNSQPTNSSRSKVIVLSLVACRAQLLNFWRKVLCRSMMCTRRVPVRTRVQACPIVRRVLAWLNCLDSTLVLGDWITKNNENRTANALEWLWVGGWSRGVFVPRILPDFNFLTTTTDAYYIVRTRVRTRELRTYVRTYRTLER